jgi:hypothetical protein
VNVRRAQIAIRPEERAPDIDRVATTIDQDKRQLNDSVMGVWMKTGRLAVNNDVRLLIQLNPPLTAYTATTGTVLRSIIHPIAHSACA